MKDQGRIEEVKAIYNEVPFFQALMSNSMMSLTKCYFELTSYMKEDKEYGDFWVILHDEYQLTKEMLLLISDMDILMEKEAVSRASIMIRENIVLPLLVIQQYALQKIGSQTDFKRIVRKDCYAFVIRKY